jgi:hypothetical protein
MRIIGDADCFQSRQKSRNQAHAPQQQKTSPTARAVFTMPVPPAIT